MPTVEQLALTEEFHKYYYGEAWKAPLNGDKAGPVHVFHSPAAEVTWLGTVCQKIPFDLFVYQEILWDTRPDFILECGTSGGGTTLFLASVCELLRHGCIATVDKLVYQRAYHPLIAWWVGDTLDPRVTDAARQAISHVSRTLVILDDDHEMGHVREEMEVYGSMLRKGDYLIVEDTNVNGHPVFPGHGAGPWEAVRDFLPGHPEFVQDRTREHFPFSANPGGYLLKVS